MNAIQKAAKLLREISVTTGCECVTVANELEELLKQEPIGVIRISKISTPQLVVLGDSLFCAEAGDYGVYMGPRPPCDLKALAEDVRDVCYKNEIGMGMGLTLDSEIDAIIAKHIGGEL